VTGEDARDLEAFRAGSAAAFERLARRYAGLVFTACLRRLGSREDAEDASQAVFLVLARHARSVQAQHLASWLHRTAVRAASVAARSRARRARHEEEAAQMRPATGSPPPPEWAEARRHLDAELDALPARLREAVGRQFLVGQSRAEIARELAVPEGTVASRVAAGLERLRERLSRRGAGLSSAALGGLLASEAQSAVPQTLLASLPHLATGVTVASAAAGAGASVSAVVEGVLKMMFWAKVKLAAAVSTAVLALGLAIPVVSSLAGDGDKPVADKPADAKKGKIAAGKPKYEERNGKAWEEQGRIVGRVRQAPAFKAEALDADGKAVLSTDVAAGAKSYELQWLKPGVYTLRVSAEGYETLEVKGLEVKARSDLLVGLEFESK